MLTNLFEKILVPYDGSNFSKKAVKQAIDISDRFDSTIHLVTVINIGHIKPPGSLLGLTTRKSKNDLASKLSKKVRREYEKSLGMEVAKCKKKGRTADYTISTGNVAEEILKLAKKKKITLIIIGSQGLHGISKFKALGSTSRKISELANCPVLIVR